MAVLRTKRLLLRPMVKGDLDDFYEYCSQPEVGPKAGWLPHQSKKESYKIMKKIFLNQESVWGIIFPEKNKLIGTIGLVPDISRNFPNSRMIGYSLSKTYWGNGYMTESVLAVLYYGFSVMGLDLISANCYPDNPASKRVLEKSGFYYEGYLRMAEQVSPTDIKDHLCFSRLKEEYINKKE